MANYERGVYEPSDEVRVFDGAEDDEEDVEGSRLPLLIVLALLVLAMFAGVVWLAYTQGVARGRGETPVLAAAPGPERVAPQAPGGANVPYQGFKIYEQPAPADDEADASGSSAPAAPVTPPATPKIEPPPVVADAPRPAPGVTAPPAPTAPAPKPVLAMKAAAPAAIEKPVVAKVAPPPVEKPAPAPKVAAARPVLSPPPPMKKAVSTAPLPDVVPAGGAATGAPRTLPGIAAATTPKPVAPKPVAAAPAPSAAKGAFVLQIGAYKSEGDAQSAWSTYKARHAALLSGYGPDVQRADLGDKGTWYRLRIAGFSDRDVASGLCDRLKADGGGCFLGK